MSEILSMENEEWRDIAGYIGQYQVSNLGRIRSLQRTHIAWNGFKQCVFHRKGNIVKLCPIGAGNHLSASLMKNGVKKTLYIHRLVLESFVGPCPEGMEGRHFPDRNPNNNRLENLSWGTHTENMQDKIIHGTNGGWKLPESAIRKLRSKTVSADVRAKISIGLKAAYKEGRR